jgi:hypothetical protein
MMTLSPSAATWLLWAMSWRGESTARQIASPPLHAPTLLLKWWTSMPASLCFGPAGNLLCVLGNCVERLYRFWRCVVERMRSSGWYLLDPRLVSIKFKAIAVGETPEILRRLTLLLALATRNQELRRT